MHRALVVSGLADKDKDNNNDTPTLLTTPPPLIHCVNQSSELPSVIHKILFLLMLYFNAVSLPFFVLANTR